jgi:hypothetical protein
VGSCYFVVYLDFTIWVERWFNDLFVYSVKGKKQTCFPLKGINKVWSKIKSTDDGNMEKNLSPH